jgi:hypothetical protein
LPARGLLYNQECLAYLERFLLGPRLAFSVSMR